MTEEERNAFAKWINSQNSEFPLALELIKSSKDGGLYFEVPETNGFPANRFMGRLQGYMYTLASERVKTDSDFSITIESISPYASAEEIAALELLQQKIKEQQEKDIPPFDDGYVGRLEGIVVFLDNAELSLLYTETNIDLNRGRDARGIPSYAYHKSHLKAGLLLAVDNSREEVIKGLMKDGIGEKGAIMITDRMIGIVKQQKKQSAIKTFFLGVIILAVGLLITCLTYFWASEGRNNRYILAWGALGGGGYFLVKGLVDFFKAVRYKGR